MEAKNVYQDASGKWQIEYSSANLMGLALRVYAGEFFLGIFMLIFLVLPLIVLSVLITMVSATSIRDKPNIAPPSNSDVPQKSVCQQISNHKLKLKSYK